MKKVEITKEQYHLNKKHFIRNSEIFYTVVFDKNGNYLGYKHEALSCLSDILIKDKNEKIASFINHVSKKEKYIIIDSTLKRKIISIKKIQRRDSSGRFKKSISLVKYEDLL